ncbi:hypothetical protein [Mesorhizobium sp. J428]|uniref:hypothetical protein n=1 Tax=Mesorhizobium sp. J428 TaxID=2898440 RepID=UPI002150A8D3|nr:hypothetical protein [Mesorhizobium sp. J428]MCR5856586.1 hypothetical protein [Mesorhizobium sp. J428]
MNTSVAAILLSELDDVAGEAHEMLCMAHLLSDTANALLARATAEVNTVTITSMDREVTMFGIGELIARSARLSAKADKALAAVQASI